MSTKPGTYRGPFPPGVALRIDLVQPQSLINGALVVNHPDSVPTMDVWILEVGIYGYRIKNAANQGYLSYQAYDIPALLVDKLGFICTTTDSPVEWNIIQASEGVKKRTFHIRLADGPHLQPTETFFLVDGLMLRPSPNRTSVFNSSFNIQVLDRRVPHDITTLSLNSLKGNPCVIRSEYNPALALSDLLVPFNSELVLTRLAKAPVGVQQTWTISKGRDGFKIQNAYDRRFLTADIVKDTPSTDTSIKSLISRASPQTDWAITAVGDDAFEIYLPSDPSRLLTIWNGEAGSNGWVYLGSRSKAEDGAANQRWILTDPNTTVADVPYFSFPPKK